MLPTWYLFSVVFIFGLVIGSFLNVVIYRLHTGRSLNDRSHCLSCGEHLKWYELIPVFSYLFLRGRCRHCHSLIPLRYLAVEFTVGFLFVLALTKQVDIFAFFLLLVFLSILVVGTVYDLYHMIIPDEVSWGGLVLVVLLLFYQSWLLGSWWPLLSGLLAAGGAFAFFALLWWISKGRWLGFGDAKLSLSLSALVGLGSVFSLLVFSFWIGAVISLLMMLIDRLLLHINYKKSQVSRVRMKSEIPFAPFLVMAFLVVYFTDVRVLSIVEMVLLKLGL